MIRVYAVVPTYKKQKEKYFWWPKKDGFFSRMFVNYLLLIWTGLFLHSPAHTQTFTHVWRCVRIKTNMSAKRQTLHLLKHIKNIDINKFYLKFRSFLFFSSSLFLSLSVLRWLVYLLLWFFLDLLRSVFCMFFVGFFYLIFFFCIVKIYYNARILVLELDIF